MIGSKGPGSRSTVDRLQHRRLHLNESPLIQKAADGRNDPRPDPKDLPHLRVDCQIDVALPVALLFVGKGIEYLSVLLLDHRQWAQGLGQQPQLLDAHTGLARTCEEHSPRGLYKVAQVQLVPEHGIRLVSQKVPPQIQLKSPAAILDVRKR